MQKVCVCGGGGGGGGGEAMCLNKRILEFRKE
jgi:hypothetical protein